MEFSNNCSKNYFDFLPDEMVVLTLSFVDAVSLLNCRLVCKRWRTLVDAHVFQEKASRENNTVNDGRGYYSFSEIDSKTVRKLDLPWYVFYAICKYDPFNRNLVKSHCGQSKLNENINLYIIVLISYTYVKSLFGINAVWFIRNYINLIYKLTI